MSKCQFHDQELPLPEGTILQNDLCFYSLATDHASIHNDVYSTTLICDMGCNIKEFNYQGKIFSFFEYLPALFLFIQLREFDKVVQFMLGHTTHINGKFGKNR
jgi:hypothetical protein